MSEPNRRESSADDTVKTETVVVIVLGILFVLFMVFAIFWDDRLSKPGAAVPAPPVGEFAEDWSQYSDFGETNQVGGYAPVGGSGTGSGTSSGINREMFTVAGLERELKRIVRAGRRLEVLRNSKNLTLTKRCLEASQALKSQVSELQRKSVNISVPDGSTSLGDVLRQALLCVSCSSDARQYCGLADQALDLTGL